jgi:hypothetical protein
MAAAGSTHPIALIRRAKKKGAGRPWRTTPSHNIHSLGHPSRTCQAKSFACRWRRLGTCRCESRHFTQPARFPEAEGLGPVVDLRQLDQHCGVALDQDAFAPDHPVGHAGSQVGRCGRAALSPTRGQTARIGLSGTDALGETSDGRKAWIRQIVAPARATGALRARNWRDPAGRFRASYHCERSATSPCYLPTSTRCAIRTTAA